MSKREWLRFEEIASRSVLAQSPPLREPSPAESREFLDLLRKCESAGLRFKGMNEFEDNCPICVEGKKMVVLQAFRPEVKPQYQSVRIDF